MLKKEASLKNKEEECILLSPEKLGYEDRGMVKWQGFLLSDHVEAMKKQKEKVEYTHPSRRSQLSLEETAARLFEAYNYDSPVSIQMNQIQNGQFSADKIGQITGFHEQVIYLHTAEECIELEFNTIRHIELLTWEEYQNIRMERKDDFYG